MGLNINTSGLLANYSANSSGWGVNTHSKQFQAAWNDVKDDLAANLAMMTPEERLVHETFFKNTGIKNRMALYDANGDYVGPGGIVVAGMASEDSPATNKSKKLIRVTESGRDAIFNETKRHFIQENGVLNGDTTNRSSIFRDYQRSIKKEDRVNGTYSLEQYERQYYQAMYDAVKTANPEWELGKPFDTSILDSITREGVDKTLVKAGNTLVRRGIDISI